MFTERFNINKLFSVVLCFSIIFALLFITLGIIGFVYYQSLSTWQNNKCSIIGNNITICHNCKAIVGSNTPQDSFLVYWYIMYVDSNAESIDGMIEESYDTYAMAYSAMMEYFSGRYPCWINAAGDIIQWNQPFLNYKIIGLLALVFGGLMALALSAALILIMYEDKVSYTLIPKAAPSAS
jgi:hypothetical protein